MSAKEIKNTMFKEFLVWLDKTGHGDHFSMDVWMSKAWDNLYERFLNEQRTMQAMNFAIKGIPKEKLLEEIQTRDEKEKPQ